MQNKDNFNKNISTQKLVTISMDRLHWRWKTSYKHNIYISDSSFKFRSLPHISLNSCNSGRERGNSDQWAILIVIVCEWGKRVLNVWLLLRPRSQPRKLTPSFRYQFRCIFVVLQISVLANFWHNFQRVFNWKLHWTFVAWKLYETVESSAWISIATSS
jgi:hypothetical protein